MLRERINRCSRGRKDFCAKKTKCDSTRRYQEPRPRSQERSPLERELMRDNLTQDSSFDNVTCGRKTQHGRSYFQISIAPLLFGGAHPAQELLRNGNIVSEALSNVHKCQVNGGPWTGKTQENPTKKIEEDRNPLPITQFSISR